MFRIGAALVLVAGAFFMSSTVQYAPPAQAECEYCDYDPSPPDPAPVIGPIEFCYITNCTPEQYCLIVGCITPDPGECWTIGGSGGWCI